MSVLTKDLVCQQAVELATEYLEGSLSRRERRAFERHLAACDGCETYLDQIRAVLVAEGTVGPEALDEPALAALVDLFHATRGDRP